VAALTELRDAMAAGRATRVLLKNYRKDGSVFWNDLCASPLFDPAGRITHYVAVQTDVTERMARGTLEAKHLEAFAAERTRELDASLRSVEDRRRFTETILNGLSAGLITADAAGNVSFANRAALHTLGMSLADCMGRSVVEIFGGSAEVREVIASPPDTRREARLDFPVISPGGVRLYVGMSVMRVPEELRAELAFVFLFRNLAETLERDDLNALGPEAAPTAGIEPAPRAPVDEGPSAEAIPRKRRPVLALRYCAVPDLVDRATELLAAQFPDGEKPNALDGVAGLPEVLVDRDQVADALARLLGNAAHRAGGLSRVRVKLEETEAVSERGVRSGAFVRVDILFPREEITEEDLHKEDETSGRREPRRSDLVTAEQLLQANGGRVVLSPPGPTERFLSALIPAARRPAGAREVVNS
jgi:PAS domain S-box-containing protein